MTVTSERTAVALPGIDLPGRPGAPRPDQLLAPGVLLLSGLRGDGRQSIDSHRATWGPQPEATLDDLAAAAEAVGLVGAGGAGFPTARKLQSVAGQRVTAVIVNGSEGESASAKDGVLLSHVPHLVLDGAVAVARATRCKRVVIRLAADRPQVIASVHAAIVERSDRALRFEVSVGDAAFVAGEATAVINAVAGETPLPADLGRPPKTPSRPLRTRTHVFLSNVETFARLAVASRGDRRTSSLITVSGAVSTPGVLEVVPEVTLAQVAEAVGLIGRPDLVITGGWHGAWTPWSRIRGARMNRDEISAAGGRWGAGAFVFLPDDVDPRLVIAAIAEEMGRESAGQCGPCVFGLPALAAALHRTRGPGGSRHLGEVQDMLAAVDGRGLCAHPTATAAAVRSALTAIESGGMR